jgi:hypothetical protein
MRILTVIFVGFVCLIARGLYAQDEAPAEDSGIPVQIEYMGGNNKYLFQSIFIKPLGPKKKIDFFFFNYFDRYHKTAERSLNESLIQSYAARSLGGGFSAGAGMTYHSAFGLSPNLMLQYVVAGKDYLVVLFPVYYMDKTQAGELFTQMQYRPTISKQCKLFTQLMGVSNWSHFQTHSRSWQQIRLGLDYKTFQFGLGLGFDQYGTNELLVKKNTIGLFLRKEF